MPLRAPKSNSNPSSEPEDLLPLGPSVYFILLSLSDGEKHGYAIMQEIRASSNNTVSIGPGTLYGSLRRMVELRLIEETDERPAPDLDNERRRYYHITDFGRRVAESEAQRLAQMVQIARTKNVLHTPTAQPQPSGSTALPQLGEA